MGEGRAVLGVGSDVLVEGGRGIWPLEFEIRVVPPPEAGGSGGEELTLSLRLSGARP